MTVRHLLLRPLVAMLLAAAPAPDSGLSREQLAALREVDLRMATIGWRLATANVALCDRRGPATGMVLHALSQYDAATHPAARAVFGFAAPVAVEAVVPGSAAARAGVRAEDTLVAVAGRALPVAASGTVTAADRDAAMSAIAAQPLDRPLAVTLRRDGTLRDVALAPSPACAAQFEVLIGPDMTAQADARTVQIGVRFLERYTDNEVAVIAAHELAHVVLRHRERLEAAGVSNGVLAELGRNGRLHRRVEDEADALGVVLLRNAGYDPASAPRFWRSHGGEIDGGVFRSRTHRSSSARASRLEAIIAALPAERPVIPTILATRTEPLR